MNAPDMSAVCRRLRLCRIGVIPNTVLGKMGLAIAQKTLLAKVEGHIELSSCQIKLSS